MQKSFILVGLIWGVICHAAESYTNKETTAALAQFKKMITDEELYLDYMKTDEFLVAWLEKEKLDVNRTTVKLREALKWRKAKNVDSVLTEDISKFRKSYPFDSDSVDRQGRPVVIFQIGRWDFRRIALAGKQAEFERYAIYLYEDIKDRIRKQNASSPHGNITQHILVTDMHGYNLRQHGCILCIPLLLEFEGISQRYYPESIYKAFLVNTPGIFDSLNRILRPIFTEQTTTAIQVFDNDRGKWINELLKYISADQLPVQYGGKRTTNHLTTA